MSYSHDSFGLGHLRRSVSVASALVNRAPQADVVCVTGSPTPDLFELPPRCDLVKLPCITKDTDGRYTSRSLRASLNELIALRSEILTAVARSFRPDLVLIDHTPLGPAGELLPVLRRIRHETTRTRVVLGLRDVVDAPHRVRAEMAHHRSVDVLRRDYDAILVYGDRRVLDVCQAYSIPADLHDRVHYVGFACPPVHRLATPGAHDVAGRRILASAGGGADGYELLRGVVAAVRGPLRERDLDVTVVAGPLMERHERDALRAAAQDDPRIRILGRTRDMPALLRETDVVVGMGGYNTVYEALSHGRALLVMPRAHPRREQTERCRRLEAMGLLSILPSAQAAEPQAMAASLCDALADTRERSVPPLPFDGAERAAEHLLACLAEKTPSSVAGS